MKSGGCAKESRRAELARKEAQRICFHYYKSPEQEAKSQQIVGQSLLSCLQYPIHTKSSTMDLSLPMFKIAIKYDVEPEGLLECE